MVRPSPLADPPSEAERVAAAAAEADIALKLMGGAAVFLHSESARRPPLRRRCGDLDFVALARQRAALDSLFVRLGYRPEVRFNTLNGDRRLLYLDPVNRRQVDVFLDAIRMCHLIDLRAWLHLGGPCLTPADLLLSKLQIYELNQKDLVDVLALLLDHPVADHDEEAINAPYVASLTAGDWGLHRTLDLNRRRILEAVERLPVDAVLVRRRLAELWQVVEAEPKSLGWRLRARIGDRWTWYQLPEEVRQPYQPE